MESITIQTVINADAKKVWNYYTQPKHIINWNFASPDWCCPNATNDLRVGGVFLARMEAKDGSFGFDFQGVYTAINAGNSFSYLLDDKRSVRMELTEEFDHIKITVAFDVEGENDIEMQRNGWQAILNNFKNYTENN